MFNVFYSTQKLVEKLTNAIENLSSYCLGRKMSSQLSLARKVSSFRTEISVRAFLLLFILNFAFPGLLMSAEFESFDFMRFLNKHPVISRYDPETGRFKDTKSAPVPLIELEAQINELSAKLEELGLIKARLLQESLTGDELLDEDGLWARISGVDAQISKINDELIKKQELYSLGGTPDVDTMLELISNARKDIEKAYPAGKIVLNRLPPYPASPPEFPAGKDLKSIFFNPDAELLTDYIRAAWTIGMLFERTKDPIIYTRESDR